MIKQEELIKVLLSPSTTSWDELQDKVLQILNIHPASLQLQYCFSNEKNNSLFFNLDSHDDYIGMCGQLRPFVVLRIFSNGKPSKSGGLYTPPHVLPETPGILECLGGTRAKSAYLFQEESGRVHWKPAYSSGVCRICSPHHTTWRTGVGEGDDRALGTFFFFFLN